MATSLLANPLLVAETSKQITKALKCVAFTNMQVGDMMLRKHERLEKRIRSVSEEIELLRADVMENVMNQRERRQQVADIEDDVERAEVLGNALMVAELLAELRVLQEEGRREDALYRSLRKALRSRKRVKKEFIREKHVVEDEMRSFNRKQDLIQSLLSTFAKDSSATAASRRGRSSASQSDCGSDMSDVDDSSSLVSPGEEEEEAQSEPNFIHKRRIYSPEPTRPRRWSADGTYPQTSPQKLKSRARRSASLSFPARPHSLGSVEEESDDYDEEQDVPVSAPAPAAAAAAASTASPAASSAAQEKEAEIRSSCSSEASSSLQVAQLADEDLLLEEIHDEQDNFYSHSGDSSSDDHESDSEDDHFHESPRSTTSTVVAMSETTSVASDAPNARPPRKLSLRDVESTVTSTISVVNSSNTATTADADFSTKTRYDRVEVALAPTVERKEGTAAAASTAAA